nr:YHS domain-containing protein [Acidimicrobiia bacterium]
ILAELVALRGSATRVSEAAVSAGGGSAAGEAGASSGGLGGRGGGGARGAGPADPHAEVTDPVCGMVVIPSRARFSAEHEGRRYWFCAAGCETAFRREPQGFVSQ